MAKPQPAEMSTQPSMIWVISLTRLPTLPSSRARAPLWVPPIIQTVPSFFRATTLWSLSSTSFTPVRITVGSA